MESRDKLRSAQYVLAINIVLVSPLYVISIHYTISFGIAPHKKEEIMNDENEYAYIPMPTNTGTSLSFEPKNFKKYFNVNGIPINIPNNIDVDIGIIFRLYENYF